MTEPESTVRYDPETERWYYGDSEVGYSTSDEARAAEQAANQPPSEEPEPEQPRPEQPAYGVDNPVVFPDPPGDEF